MLTGPLPGPFAVSRGKRLCPFRRCFPLQGHFQFAAFVISEGGLLLWDHFRFQRCCAPSVQSCQWDVRGSSRMWRTSASHSGAFSWLYKDNAGDPLKPVSYGHSVDGILGQRTWSSTNWTLAMKSGEFSFLAVLSLCIIFKAFQIVSSPPFSLLLLSLSLQSGYMVAIFLSPDYFTTFLRG